MPAKSLSQKLPGLLHSVRQLNKNENMINMSIEAPFRQKQQAAPVAASIKPMRTLLLRSLGHQVETIAWSLDSCA